MTIHFFNLYIYIWPIYVFNNFLYLFPPSIVFNALFATAVMTMTISFTLVIPTGRAGLTSAAKNLFHRCVP
jgi:hypothetical protein